MEQPKGPKEKPKRPLSAYNFFFKAERQKLLASKQRTGFAGMARVVAMKWKTATDTRRYEDLARKEKIRYIHEMEEWKKEERARKRDERESNSSKKSQHVAASSQEGQAESRDHLDTSQSHTAEAINEYERRILQSSDGYNNNDNDDNTLGLSISPIPFDTDASIQEKLNMVAACDNVDGGTPSYYGNLLPQTLESSSCLFIMPREEGEEKQEPAAGAAQRRDSLHSLLSTPIDQPFHYQQQLQSPTVPFLLPVPSTSELNLKHHNMDRLTRVLGDDAVDQIIEMFGN